MTRETLTQFVAFTTCAPASDFDRRWRPVATGFLQAGVQTIALAEVFPVAGSELAGVRFVSRNTWPEDAYRRAFPTGLPGQAGAGDIQVAQPGIFRSLGATTAHAEPAQAHRSLVMAFYADASLEANGVGFLSTLDRALPDNASAAVYVSAPPRGIQPFSLVVTVHSTPDDTPAAVETLRRALDEHLRVPAEAILSGREIVTLAQRPAR